MVEKKIFFVIIELIISFSIVFGQEKGEFVNTSEAVQVPINITVVPKQMVCLFFVSAPSFVPKNEIVIFHTVNVNCGNMPVNGTTLIRIVNSTGYVFKERSRKFFLNKSLERLPFNLFFSATVPNGTYTVVAKTHFNNTTISINRTFDVVTAAWNLTQRIPIYTPLKIIEALKIHTPEEELNASRGNTLLVPLRIENMGTVDLLNVKIVPVVPTGWNATPAYINKLPFNGNITRNVGVTPGKDVLLTSHLILVEAIYKNKTLDRDFFIVRVRAKKGVEMSIDEYPVVFDVMQGNAKNFSIIIRNTGNVTLHNLKVKLENEKECLFPYRFPVYPELDPKKTAVISAEVVGKNVVRSCKVSLILSSEEGATKTVIVTVRVKKRAGFPALFLTGIINFVEKNPILSIGLIVFVIVAIRLINYFKYRSREVTT